MALAIAIFVVPLLCRDSTWHKSPAAKDLITRYLLLLALTTMAIEPAGRPFRLVMSPDPEMYLTVAWIQVLVVE